MNDADMQAEQELMADLQRMAETVCDRFNAGDPPAVWQGRREQIAALQQRVRALRAQHLGQPDRTPRAGSQRRLVTPPLEAPRPRWRLWGP